MWFFIVGGIGYAFCALVVTLSLWANMYTDNIKIRRMRKTRDEMRKLPQAARSFPELEVPEEATTAMFWGAAIIGVFWPFVIAVRVIRLLLGISSK